MPAAEDVSACGEGKGSRAFAPPLVVAAAGLVTSFPVWFYGWPAAGDVIFHASWFTHFDAQLRAGELYPRWLAGMNDGLGSPAFYYYPALPFYFASILRLLVPAGPHNLGALGAAAALAFTASGLAAYAWLKKIADARSAAAAAVIYLLVPYHSAVDLYAREAFAELWAFVWMPLVLKFSRALGEGAHPPAALRGSGPGDEEGREAVAGSSRDGCTTGAGAGSIFDSVFGTGLNFVWLAVAYALLCASHLPATLIFSPVPVAYAYLTSRRLRAPLRAAAAMLFGACLSAVYLLPALAMQDAVSFGNMHPFLYMERWLTFARADARDLYGLLLWGTLTTLALVACAALAGRGPVRPVAEGASRPAGSARERGPRGELIFWIAVAAASALLMTFVSDPVWRVLTVLQRVQFPWRFGLVLSVAAAAVVALGLGSSREGGGRANPRMLAFGGMVIAAWLVLLAGAVWRAYPLLPRPGFAVSGPMRSMYERGRDAPEYRPRWTNIGDEGDIERMLRQVCGQTPPAVRACVQEGEGLVTVTRRGPRSLDLRVESAGGLTFRVTQFYFPGWAATLDGRPHPLGPSRPDGLLLLDAPAGTHTIRLTLEPTLPERLGLYTSIASALLLALLSARTLLPRLGRMRRATGKV